MSIKKQASSLLDKDNSILSFLDKAIPTALTKELSELFKARTLVLMVSILVIISIISMASIIAVDQTVNERRLITIFLISLQPVALCLMWWKKSIKIASWFVIGILTLTIMYIDFNNASFKGAFSIVWMLPTTLAVILLGGRAALKVTVVCVLGMTVNFILLKNGGLPEPITPPEKWINVEFIISVTVMLIITFSVYALARMAKQKELELSNEINSRKQIAFELEEAKNIAEHAADNKSMFLATMSHELRTPLNAILGNAELMSREQLEEKTESRVNDIHSAGQLLISIINDVLDLSKFDTYGIELSNEIYDISDQLKRIHRMMASKVKPGVYFSLEGVDSPIYVNADQNRLSQVILNLVSNAVKFTEEGQITLSLICKVDSIAISIKDTGVGISQDDAKNLFQDFVQVRKHANRQVEGTGLGLAIIQRIVDRMSGAIKLESKEAEGSTFTVELPLKVEKEIPSMNAKNIEKSPTIEEMDLTQLKLLVVDDVPMNCIILNAQLEELGINSITEKHDGEDAVAMIRQDKHFDMILMDIRMPKMDGLEASKLIRELGYMNPIIAVTANAFEEDKQACLDAGMSDFLSKPIELEKLKTVLQRNFKDDKG